MIPDTRGQEEEAEEAAAGLYRPEALKAMAEKHGISGSAVISPAPANQLLVLILLLMVVAALAFAASGRYASKTRVSGYLEHVNPPARLRAQQSGEVQQLLVKNGDQVKKGQRLLILRPASMSRSGSSTQQEMLELLARHQAGREAVNKNLDRQLELELIQLTEERDGLHKRLVQTRELRLLEERKAELLARRLAALQAMHTEGHLSDLEWTRMQEEVLNSEQQLASLGIQLSQLASSLAISERELEARQLAGLARRETAADAVVSLEQQQLQLLADTQLVVRAPADGIVRLLQVHPGQELIAGQLMLMIGPPGVRLMAVLAVPASAAGKVYPGQKIELEVSAFPKASYGTLKALVVQVSGQVQLPGDWLAPIAVAEPSYLVKASLIQSAVPANMHLKADMTLSARLSDQPRSLFSWLLGPALQVL